VNESTRQLLAGIPEKLIKALPAGFTVLILLNLMFMGALTYAVSHNTEARNQLLKTIVERCLDKPG
jgi:hypothetical protein